MKNKKLYFLLILLVIGIVSIPAATLARRLPILPKDPPEPPPILYVEFLPNPLFDTQNLKPGDSLTSQVKVLHFGWQTRPVAIQAVNVLDPDGFASVLDFEIKANEQTLFSGKLSDFFTQSEMFLSDLEGHSNVIYELSISLSSNLDNQWQSKTLSNFDIEIGFLKKQNSWQNRWWEKMKW